MKRYTKTFWNGMLEDPKGIWVKDEDARLERILLEYEIEDVELSSFILKWLLSLSILCNIGQLIYHLN